MQACYYESYGPLERVLKMGTLPVPVISRPNEVKVKVYAASINPADVSQMGGELRLLLDRPMPVKPGFDFSGVIVEKGAGVDARLQVGDEVFGMIRGLNTGTTAEFIVVDEFVVSKKPKSISHENAAGIPLAAMTAYQCLLEAGLPYPPTPDSKSKSVFVTGGPGGVGTFVIQLAKVMFGVGHVCTTASTSKIEVCKQLGADEVVDYTKISFDKALAGKMFDACVDCTHEVWKMMNIVKKGGGVVSITQAPTQESIIRWLGNMGDNPGITVGKGIQHVINGLPSPVINLFTGALFYRGRGALKGVSFNHLITRPNHTDLDEIAKHADSIKVLVDSVFPLKDSVQAYARVASKKAVGKVIVKVIDA